MKTIIFLLMLTLCTFIASAQLTPSQLIQSIDTNITTNGRKQITGAIMNYELKQIVNTYKSITDSLRPTAKVIKLKITQSGADDIVGTIMENTFNPALSFVSGGRSIAGAYGFFIYDQNSSTYFNPDNEKLFIEYSAQATGSSQIEIFRNLPLTPVSYIIYNHDLAGDWDDLRNTIYLTFTVYP